MADTRTVIQDTNEVQVKRLPEVVPITIVGTGVTRVKVLAYLPNPEAIMLYGARVSSSEQNSGKPGLINSLVKRKHVSPLQLPDVVLEIEGFPRTIIRQVVRHKSNSAEEATTYANTSPLIKETYDFPFFHSPETEVQEFSYRYSTTETLEAQPRDMITHVRVQNPKDRQSSVYLDDPLAARYYSNLAEESERIGLENYWRKVQEEVIAYTSERYQECLKMGIANELARNLLPEGLTPTKLIFKCNARSFYTFQHDRNPNFGAGNEAQKEIQYLADLMFKAISTQVYPILCKDMMRYAGRNDKADAILADMRALLDKNGALTSEEIQDFILPKNNSYKDVRNPFVGFNETKN